MKKLNLSNTILRFASAGAMLIAFGIIVALAKHFPSLQIVRWVSVAVVAASLYETIMCIKKAGKEKMENNKIPFVCFLLWLTFVLISAYFVGSHTLIMLWLLAIIVGADVGAWFFGKIFGGDKMWERLSEHKTWSGQIGGIICGTLMSVIFVRYFHAFGGEILFSVLFGCTISLLSQYGDLTASAIKRRIGIKDFGNILPGHGGILDRFDGWIYVLPFMWFFIK